MISQTALIGMSKDPICVEYEDAKELFTRMLIVVNPFLMFGDAKTNDATIKTCIHFNFFVSAVQENAGDLEVYRAYVAKQMSLRMSVHGAVLYAVWLLGEKEGAIALAFPSLRNKTIEERRKMSG